MAADYGNQEITDWLCSEYGLDINYVDEHNQNLLFYAADLKDLKYIKWLINDKKAEYNYITTKVNDNLLFQACMFDNLDLVKYLLDELKFDIKYKNLMGQICIFSCCHSKSTKVLDYLIDKYSFDIKNIKDKYNLTIMHNSRNKLFLDHIIKKYKFDINYFEVSDDSNELKQYHIIFYAISYENKSLIDYILNNSCASIYKIDQEYKSILFLSIIILNKYKFSKFLIKKYDIDVNYQNKKGQNILFSAISHSNFKAAKWIIENTKINIYKKDKDGYDIINDLIHYFDNNDDFEDFKELMIFIFKNTKFKFKDKYLFDICTDKTSPEINIMILKFLLETFKPNIKYVDKHGCNLLITAISFNIDVVFIKYLIDLNKLNILQVDNKGKDAFKYASNHEKSTDILCYLYYKTNELLNVLSIQYKHLKLIYTNLLRSKPVVKDPLNDSGTDITFDTIKITDQDKINMFDDLLAHTTNLKLQILTLDREPVECKNTNINNLI